MAGHDIIVVGASAGGVEALTELVRGLPADLPAAVFVTIHFPSAGTSVLPRILTRQGKLQAEHASDGEPIEPGRIYVAPPDYHLLLRHGRMELLRGPRENGHRPAIDPLFRSAAVAFGPRVIGVVLSGNLDDGTSGLMAVQRRGGIVVVQDPEEAPFPSMPQSAIDNLDVDHVSRMKDMGPLLAELARVPAARLEVAVSDDARKETEYTEIDLETIEDTQGHPGDLSMFGCPDCGGTLWVLREGDLVRYRCRVGHAWSSDGLLARQAETLDGALWTALRALEESASLSRQMANRAKRRGNTMLAERFEDNAMDAEYRAGIIREVLLQNHSVEVEADASRAGARTPSDRSTIAGGEKERRAKS